MADLYNIDLTSGRKLSDPSNISLVTNVNNIESRLRGESTSKLSNYVISNNDILQSWIIDETEIDTTYNYTTNRMYTSSSWYNSDSDWIENSYSTIVTTISDQTNTIQYVKKPKFIQWYTNKKSDDMLSRLRDEDRWVSYTSDSILYRIKAVTHNNNEMENSINRFMDEPSFDDDYDTIDRLRETNGNDRFGFDSYFHNDNRKLSDLIPFLKRLYSTSLGRSFDRIEFNFDMVIAKERFEDAIKDTIYSLSSQETTNKINTNNEVQIWITPTTRSDLIII